MKNYTLLRTQYIPYRTWHIANWKCLQSVYEDISLDNLQKYVHDVMSVPGNVWRKNSYANIDKNSEIINVFNGIRRTVRSNDNQPECRVLMYGDSRMYGVGVEDKDTLPSQLQFLMENNNYNVEVLNLGVRGDVLVNIYERIENSIFKKNDILVIFLTVFSTYSFEHKTDTRYQYYTILNSLINKVLERNLKLLVFKFPDIRIKKRTTNLEKFFQKSLSIKKKYTLICPDISLKSDSRYIDTQNAVDKVPEQSSAFWDFFHPGPILNKEIAKFIYPYIEYTIRGNSKFCVNYINMSETEQEKSRYELKKFKNNCSREYILQEKRNILSAERLYKKYPKFTMCNDKKIGAIVMNCNPFSIGHIYLIEKALTKSDYIYIFIVNEDKSKFSFEHRLFMVRKYFANNKRIIVLPSGNLMISSLTFPEYFDKSNNSDKNIDTSLDIAFFATIIAKIFNISIRFVGDEPYCNTTRQYNAMMKNELPKYGIELCEIERKTDKNGLPISASYIRECINCNELNKLKDLVPQITYDIITNYYM